jgi:hypothetical protein
METYAASSIERVEMLNRIDLANRPSLDIGVNRLGEVAGVLAGNKTDRFKFMRDPASYLNEQAIEVGPCSLVETDETRAERPGTAFGPDCLLSICTMIEVIVVIAARVIGQEVQSQLPAVTPLTELL